MASIKLYVERRKDKKTGEVRIKNVPIVLSFSYEGARLMLLTGEKIDVNKWDVKKQRVKTQVNGAIQINHNLEALKEKVMKLYREAKLREINVTNEYLKTRIKGQKSVKKSVYEYFEEFLEDNYDHFSVETTKKLKSNLNHLVKFSKQKKYKVEFDSIDDRFCKMYVKYFYELGHTNNTIAKSIKNLKWFLKWASSKGYNQNMKYLEFKVQQYKTKIISLSIDEVKQLINYSPTNIRLQQVKDVFLFACFTGLRYSDVSRLNHSHIKDGYIELRTQKTNSDVSIPLVTVTNEILNRYEDYPMDTVLPIISNQKMNKYLKELGELAGLDEEITIYKYRGKDVIEQRFKKYEKLSCHIARKTFISIAFRMGMSTDIIKSISTHKSDDVFQLYNDIKKEHKSEQMNKIFDLIV